MSERNRVYGFQWRRVRRGVLERDAYICRIRGPKCEGKAGDVDHIIPWQQGGAWYDPANLQAVCRTCHNQKPNRGLPVTGERRPSREW
jgi:5-methylcytosine-specific restriction enzyme A